MEKPFKVAPTDDTIKNQRIAGEPTKSIWVSANAGSGKTHILTLRVLRLLLSGVAPENILCLTYTKAAAAEMKNRVARDLGNWVVLSDEELHKSLSNITNKRPSAEMIVRARTLFALALETPGGLKISTIHAFCESALHRFPLEADVPVDFAVIEDDERSRLIQNAKERVLSRGENGNQAINEAVANLFTLMSDDQINSAVKDALGQGRELRVALSNVDISKMNLRQLVNYDPQRTPKIILDEVVTNCALNAEECTILIEQLHGDPDKTRGARFVDILARMDVHHLSVEGLIAAFLTGAGKPRATLMTKGDAKKFSDILSNLEKERDRIAALFEEAKSNELVIRSESLLDIMGAIQRQYEAGKTRTGRLDFDDLIVKFEQLLSSKSDSDWVRYKLDAGMSHILVDESQDTNPDQWRVVKRLVEDFFAGDSAAQHQRTIFGVGDEKQSIFGFQGAEPALFAETGRLLHRQAKQSGNQWDNIRFPASFRTQENILMGVDAVCAHGDIRKALLSIDRPVTHESARADKGGSITLWPPMVVEKTVAEGDGQNEWPTAPAPSTKGAPRLTAERIAAQIKHWIDTKRAIGTRKQAVRADDILVLVQTRSPVFHEIIRALKNANIATPGADRLSVTKHIVVADLLALGDIMLNKNDDLTLATLLRSPLFNVSIEQLEMICAQRDKHISVWRALLAAAAQYDWAKNAYEELGALQKNLNQTRPYEFFAQLLFSFGGMKKFHARLGREIDEIIDVFLDLALEHEQSKQPSLQGFLAEMRAKDVEVKRELSEGGGGVRVMTVHGAKGLEAPIVILADGTKTPQLKGSVFIETTPKPMFLHGSKDQHTAQTLEEIRRPKEEKEAAEYWRKLYVAMTRAEDELYITGVKPQSNGELKSDRPQSWYGAVHNALAGSAREVDIVADTEKGLRFPAEFPLPQAIGNKQENIGEAPIVFETTSLAVDWPIQTIRPSSAFDDSEKATGDAILSGKDAEKARLKGTALHNLLEQLAPVDEVKREKIGLHAIEQLFQGEEKEQVKLVETALSILSGDDANFLFGPHSRAELPLFVFGEKNQKPVQIIGRVDRMVVTDNVITLVDFKSNAQPPSEPNALSMGYKTQMGLYLLCGLKLFPTFDIRTAIYWTGNKNLMALPNDMLLEASKQFNIT